MANYTNEIRVMMEKVLNILLEYDRKGLELESVAGKITLTEWTLIKYIGYHDNVSISLLTDVFKIDRGQASTYLNKFVRMKILIKVKDEKDKRKSYLVLTELGKKLYLEMSNKEDKALAFIYDEITINEEKVVLKLLSKITQLTIGKNLKE